MKSVLHAATALVLIMALAISCKKESPVYNDAPTAAPSRKVLFWLYTDQDFSNDDHNISFALFIKDSTSKVLWDTTLPVMKVKDIPALSHKLVIEKSIPGNNNSLLNLGFTYGIENVGYSWYLDTCQSGTTLKTVNFNFR